MADLSLSQLFTLSCDGYSVIVTVIHLVIVMFIWPLSVIHFVIVMVMVIHFVIVMAILS